MTSKFKIKKVKGSEYSIGFKEMARKYLYPQAFITPMAVGMGLVWGGAMAVWGMPPMISFPIAISLFEFAGIEGLKLGDTDNYGARYYIKPNRYDKKGAVIKAKNLAEAKSIYLSHLLKRKGYSEKAIKNMNAGDIHRALK
jgi:hypothetical protein